MPRTNRLDRFAFGFLQNPDLLFLTKPTLLHFVLPFFFAQNSTFATSSFSVSGHFLGYRGVRHKYRILEKFESRWPYLIKRIFPDESETRGSRSRGTTSKLLR